MLRLVARVREFLAKTQTRRRFDAPIFSGQIRRLSAQSETHHSVSCLGDFTNVVATGLWPVCSRGVVTSGKRPTEKRPTEPWLQPFSFIYSPKSRRAESAAFLRCFLKYRIASRAGCLWISLPRAAKDRTRIESHRAKRGGPLRDRQLIRGLHPR